MLPCVHPFCIRCAPSVVAWYCITAGQTLRSKFNCVCPVADEAGCTIRNPVRKMVMRAALVANFLGICKTSFSRGEKNNFGENFLKLSRDTYLFILKISLVQNISPETCIEG